jgi:hypothetical protein
MKAFVANICSRKSITVGWVLLFFVAPLRLATSATFDQARVSQVIRDVRLLEANAASHAAVVNDKITVENAVHTGVESRAELTFPDLTLTRLGANTTFRLRAGAREVDLTNGTILLQVPSGGAPVRASTTSITVGVMGGTGLLATGPPTKFMVLEGIGTFYPKGHPEKAVTVHSGEMMMMTKDRRVTQPEKFDVKLVLETSALIVDFPPLANLPLILAVVNRQLAAQQLAGATTQPLAKNLVDVINMTSQNTNANPVVVAATTSPPIPTPPTPTPPTPTPPPPTPSKFGTPVPISSPDPYLITSGTTITTDPAITANGVTDFGKIYRDPTDDGAFSLWAFGSTSAFDTALKIDTQFFANPNNLLIAVFKFQSLSLIGNPTIDLSNGGVTKLGLIGVDGITSGPPGGTLTFTGLNTLFLATVNGPITLTSDVSFDPLSLLAIYARGTRSTLTINSPISNIGDLKLAAENSIQLTNPGTMSVGQFDATAGNNLMLQIGGSLSLNGEVKLDTLVLPGTTLASGANLTLNVTGDYTNSSTTDFSRLEVMNEGAHIGTGGNINANIGGNLTAMNDFSLVVHNTNGQIDNGGNITLATNGSISTGGEFNLLVENYNETANPAGHIGTGGNISLTTGGNFTADFASIALNNRGGGTIDSGVNLTIDIGGALTTLHDGSDFLGNTASLSVAISSRYDDTSGNTQRPVIGGPATLNLHADSASIGGGLSVFVSNRGGTIGGNALLNFNVTHDVTVTGVDIPMFSTAADIELLNGSGSNVGSPFGGTIHGDATLQLSAANLTLTNAAGSLFVSIDNRNGGVIDSNATLSFNLTGNLTTQGGADIQILNNQNSFSNGLPGGSIGSAATLNISAANISIGTDFTARILDHRAQAAPGPGAGSIGTDATLTINAGSLTTGGAFDVSIFNRNAGVANVGGTGGSIGGNAAINLNIAGTLSSGGHGDVEILNESVVAGSPGGTIGGNAAINISAGNISTAGSFDAEIDNYDGGKIGGAADVAVNLSGAASTLNAPNGTGTFYINNAGGNVGAGAAVSVSAGAISTNVNVALDSLFARIDNPNGVIGDGAKVSLTTTGNVTSGEFVADIENYNGGHIGLAADVEVQVGALNATGAAFFDIFNPNGIIGTDASILASATSITTSGDLVFNLNNHPGTIGGNASVLAGTGAVQSGGGTFFDILNNPGTISLAARVDVNATSLKTIGPFEAYIDNSGGGTVGSDATVHVGTTGNVTTDSLFVQINNTNGSIAGNATVDVGVGGTATVTNNATVQILGNDPTGSAAIFVIGGSYSVGGTFLSSIDGNGTITFTNTDVHAKVVQAGVFGANGSLIIGGSGSNTISADTLLKLYAPGSNGLLKFVANVTLSSSTAMDLAANTITINNGVAVTIAGAGGAANIYTNNANYSGFGGNGSTTGTFAGAGAKSPLPISSAPPFGDPPVTPVPPSSATTTNVNTQTLTGTKVTTSVNSGGADLKTAGTKTSGTAINISSTNELLSLLDGAQPSTNGKITIPGSKSTSNSRNASRTSASSALKANHGAVDLRQTRDRSVIDSRLAGGKRLL